MADSTVTIAGSVGQEPELRYSQGGIANTSFSVAVNRRWQSNGEWQESTSWFRVVAFSEMAENIAASITKGLRVVVTGRLEQRSYEKDGEKKTSFEIVADEVGPSLRWATARVEKVQRNKPESSTQQTSNAFGDEEPF